MALDSLAKQWLGEPLINKINAWVKGKKDTVAYVQTPVAEYTEEYARLMLSGEREITTHVSFPVTNDGDAVSRDVYLSSFPFKEARRRLRLLVTKSTVSIGSLTSDERTPEIPIGTLSAEIRNSILRLLDLKE